MNISPILQSLPRCRQVVTGNTHKDKCLDILISNIHTLYLPPIIVPPVQPDNPTTGKPSDHLVPVQYPISGTGGSVSREYKEKSFQPIPASGVQRFGNWEGVSEELNPDEQLKQLNKILLPKIKHYFPHKTVKMSNHDLPFIDWKIKSKSRQLKRIYRKQGKSEKYRKMLEEYKVLFKKASSHYVSKNVTELSQVNPGRAASILKSWVVPLVTLLRFLEILIFCPTRL